MISMKTFPLLPLLLLPFFLACFQAPKNVVPAANQIGNLCDLAYGTQPRHKLDITLPANRNANTGVIVLIHGGAWAAGDKGDFATLRELLSLQTGLAVAAINYRYATPDSVDYTDLMADVDLAMDYIDGQSAIWKVASGKFGLAGHSAGGHMALLYSYSYDSLDRVLAVSSLSGPTDLTDPQFQLSVAAFGLFDELEDLVDEAYLTHPQAYIQPSPIFHLRDLPTQLLHGQSDLLVPVSQSVNLATALAAQQIEHELIQYPNIGHNIFGPVLNNTGPVLTALDAWFSLHLN